ncbi:related to C.carbonum toxD gene [Rhynchosporium agropyri]|uniref:Related to C.carbonum toxD protein n=1 Tax=Rhynchosporium agropyri TaxID=914238 RepID=A0A1E1LCU3_9HELO|nr:related to C.carbonum toxD gene [Rhynchosporium agropyri]
MSTRFAIVQRSNALVAEDLPLPELTKSQVLVKIANSSLNPTDVQSFDGHAFGDGAVLGCDFVGVVEKVGSGVTRYKIGDKIAALIWGGKIEGLGAYSYMFLAYCTSVLILVATSTYCVAEEAVSFKVPSGLDFASASTVPLAGNTAWLALFSKDSLNIPKINSSETSLLVWGGSCKSSIDIPSSTVGAYTIQIAKKHGFNVVTTCSPHNFDVVKKHGATYVFDYNDPKVVENIAKVVPDLAYGFDCIGNSTSSTLSGQAMGSKEGSVICTVRPGKADTENVPSNVKVTDVLVFTAFLKPHVYKKVYKWDVIVPDLPIDLATHPEDHALSKEMYEKIPEWIQDGSLVPQKPRDMGKLTVDSLKEAMELNRQGKVSNEELCFQVASF